MNEQTDRLAAEFSRILRAWLTRDEMRQVVETNRTEPGYCASHSFCDANMAMHEAFSVVGIPSPADLSERSESPEHEAAVGIWNDAWERAIRAEFWTKENAAEWADAEGER